MEQKEVEKIVAQILAEWGYIKNLPEDAVNKADPPVGSIETEYDGRLDNADIAAIAESLAAFRGA